MIFRGTWSARVVQSFEIEAEDRDEFERLIQEEMAPKNVVELQDFEYFAEDPEEEEVIT